jgi:hypothetical protein
MSVIELQPLSPGKLRRPKSPRGGKRPGAGRPKSRATVITRRRANEIVDSGESPLDVMWDNMKFWRHQVSELSNRLDALIVNVENEDDRHEAITLLRQLLAARLRAQECAVDMAPYVHPRLQAIAFQDTPKEPVELLKDGVTLERAAEVYAEMIR